MELEFTHDQQKRNEAMIAALEYAKDWTPLLDLVKAVGYSSTFNFSNVLEEMVGYGLVTSKANKEHDLKSFRLYKAVKTFDDYLEMKCVELARSARAKTYKLSEDNSEYVDRIKATMRFHRKSEVISNGVSSIVEASFIR